MPKTISEEDFLKKIEGVRNPKHRLAFMLAFYQCMRVSEITALMPEHIDYGRGFIRVFQGKGKKDRDIPIMPMIKKGLKHLPIDLTRQAIFHAVKKHFGNEVHPHTLRHSGATFYLNKKKVGIRQIQQLLGHASLSTTQIYTHVTPEELKNTFDEIWQ